MNPHSGKGRAVDKEFLSVQKYKKEQRKKKLEKIIKEKYPDIYEWIQLQK